MRRLFPMLTLATGLLVGGAVAPAQAALMTRVDGSFGSGGTFDGAVTLQGFQAQGDRLVAVGTLDGELTDAAGESLGEVRDQPVRLAVNPGSLAASCEQLSARLGPTSVQARSQSVELGAVELEIGARASRGSRLRELLCGVGEKLGRGAAASALASDLDQVLAALE